MFQCVTARGLTTSKIGPIREELRATCSTSPMRRCRWWRWTQQLFAVFLYFHFKCLLCPLCCRTCVPLSRRWAPTCSAPWRRMSWTAVWSTAALAAWKKTRWSITAWLQKSWWTTAKAPSWGKVMPSPLFHTQNKLDTDQEEKRTKEGSRSKGETSSREPQQAVSQGDRHLAIIKMYTFGYIWITNHVI